MQRDSRVSLLPVRLLKAFPLLVLFSTPTISAQLTPPGNGGIERFDMIMHGLSNDLRVLMIGAHPDDEDTGLLALSVRKYGAEAAYLSLNRGEGGQNLIGNELGVDLGLLRSRELEAARIVDGATQYFTRAYDFGFTRSLEETLTLWPRDSVIKDVVRVIRSFRPHVVISVWTGTRNDGHGHHEASGVVSRLAYDVAGDAEAYPELGSEEGLSPWTPLKFYRSARFGPDNATLRDAAGDIDPRVGSTIRQISMASRSQHRSQDMGRIQPAGPSQVSVRLEDSRVSSTEGESIFSGIAVGRDRVSVIADSLRRTTGPAALSDVVPALAEMLNSMDAGDPRREAVGEAMAIATGVIVDAIAGDDELVRDQELAVATSVYNAGNWDVDLVSAALEGSDGWGSSARELQSIVRGNTVSVDTFEVRVPAFADYTQPYFLKAPLEGEVYQFDQVQPQLRGTPFDPPLLTARFTMQVLGVEFEVSREVSRRIQDQAFGERRYPPRRCADSGRQDRASTHSVATGRRTKQVCGGNADQ